MAGVPSKKHFSDVKHLPSYNNRLPVLAELLTSLCLKNDQLPRPKERSVFDGTKAAQVSVKDYLIRMCKYGHCSPPVFICMAIYIDRLCDHTGIELTSLNIHRILLSSFLVAAKLNDDIYYSNKYYASIGGTSLKETNELESYLLEKTEWELYVSPDDFATYMKDLRAQPTPSASPRLSIPAIDEVSTPRSPGGMAHAAGSPAYARRSSISAQKQSQGQTSPSNPTLTAPSTQTNRRLSVDAAVPPGKPAIRPNQSRRASNVSAFDMAEDESSKGGVSPHHRRGSCFSDDSLVSSPRGRKGSSSVEIPLLTPTKKNSVPTVHNVTGSHVVLIPSLKTERRKEVDPDLDDLGVS